MATQYEAILPKRYHSAKVAAKALDLVLKTFGVEAQKRMKKYPPWKPWKNPPKTGPRAGGKRTGDLGKGWESYTLVSLKSVTLVNNVAYSGYVQGDEATQTAVMASRGWQRVDTVGEEAKKVAIEKWESLPGDQKA